MIKHSRKPKRFNKQKGLNRSLVFAVLFGLIMVWYGVTRLLAANPVIYSITPSSQSATGGQTRTLNVHINPNNENIRGGNVRVNYNSAHLTLNKFTAATGTPYNVYDQLSGAGYYSFKFFTYYDTKQAANLGTLEFSVKNVPSDINSVVSFGTGNNTRAYEDSPFNPDYLPVQLNNASITIYAPASEPEKCSLDPSLQATDPKCKPCPYNASIIESSPSCKAPANSPGNSTPNTQSPNGDQPATGQQSPDGDKKENGSQDKQATPNEQEDMPNTTEEYVPDETTAVTSSGNKLPIAAILAVLGGLIFAGTGVYFMVTSNKGPKPSHSEGRLKATRKVEEKSAKIEKQKVDAKKQQDKPTPIAPLGKTEKAPELEHKKADTEHDRPQNIKANQVAEAALANIAAHKAATQNAISSEAPPVMPVPPEPDWQRQLHTNQVPKANDMPEDMFELAENHPGTYGSISLAEAEESPPEQSKPAAKEKNDKA